MKKLLFPVFLLLAIPASAEVLPAEPIILPSAPVEIAEEATTTETVNLVATTTEPIATTTEVTETISIIPGSISLKLSSTVPVGEAPVVSTSTVPLDDGLFGLIYTGFEEFVFKVFGI